MIERDDIYGISELLPDRLQPDGELQSVSDWVSAGTELTAGADRRLAVGQGEAGAKAFPVSAGQSVLLMDSENDVFYIKSTDNSGMPLPLRTFDYKERTAQSTSKTAQNAPQAVIDTSLFVTRNELEERLAELVAKSRGIPNETKGDVE